MSVTETPPLDPEATARLVEFARACKAAARAVSLYPAAHPAIGAALRRLAQITAEVTAGGAFALQVQPDKILIDGAAPARPDPVVGELAELLHRQLVAGLVVHAGADEDSWRTLLLLLSRAPDEVRADGGIGRLWSKAGGPSIEIREIDYADVLRERAGHAATIEEVVAACLRGGTTLELDDQTLQALMSVVQDKESLAALTDRLLQAAGADGDKHAALLVRLLRGLAEFLSRTQPDQFEPVLRQMATVVGRLSPDAMLSLLDRKKAGETMVGTVDVVGAVVERMGDRHLAGFVAESVIAERGASDRLAQAFHALVPDVDRRRQLVGLAEENVSASPLGQEESFPDLWNRVEDMLTTYSDESYVSDGYARELSAARTQAMDVERTSDDPPERIAGWLATVGDAALRGLDQQLLLDLLEIEADPARWRDIANTVAGHVEDLARVGHLDAAWALAERIAAEVDRPDSTRREAAAAALERLGRGAMLRAAVGRLRGTDEAAYAQFRSLCHAIGPAVIPPLAEVLSAEQDARARRRLRDILVGFGARGRESVQQLMNAANWEVRRTAAFLLREFGGTEGLKDLEPLLNDAEPLVQREAIQALVLNGDDRAFAILARTLAKGGRTRQTLEQELITMRDERAGPLFCYLVKTVDRSALRSVYASAIDALGAFGGADAVEALKHALYQGDWWAPFRTRAHRASAARALRKIGTPDALEVLREAAARGPLGVRAAARRQGGT
jgi:HEAT repeat protein